MTPIHIENWQAELIYSVALWDGNSIDGEQNAGELQSAELQMRLNTFLNPSTFLILQFASLPASVRTFSSSCTLQQLIKERWIQQTWEFLERRLRRRCWGKPAQRSCKMTVLIIWMWKRCMLWRTGKQFHKPKKSTIGLFNGCVRLYTHEWTYLDASGGRSCYAGIGQVQCTRGPASTCVHVLATRIHQRNNHFKWHVKGIVFIKPGK